MRKLICVCLLISAAFFLTVNAQNESGQWEYLVVGEGSLNLNELGRDSWELVSVISTEGYPTRYFFKRPLVAGRYRPEAEQKNKAETQKVEFIDLDIIDSQFAQKEKERRANEKLEEMIKKIKGFTIVSIKPRSWFPSSNDRRIQAEVVIDGTKELLRDGNKYRLSEVKEFIRKVANEIYKVAGLKPKYANQPPFEENINPNYSGVSIYLSVLVTYNGATKILANGTIRGDWEPEQYP